MKQALKLILIYLGYQLLSILILNGIFFIKGLTEGTDLDAAPILSATGMGWVLILSQMLMLCHLFCFRHVRIREVFFPVHPARLLLSIGCIFGAVMLSDILSLMLPLPNWMENEFDILSHNPVGICSLVLMAPLTEELLFRGAIVRALRRQGGYSIRKSILFSALFFAIIHLNPAQIPFAFFMGIVFGWVCWQSGSLIPAILGHVFNNLVAVTELVYLGSENRFATEEDFTTPVRIAIAISGLTILLVCGKILQLTKVKFEEK